MNKKGKNIELKIYELLGIKTFRNVLFKLVYISLIPFTREMTKKERKSIIYNTPSNYIMKKGHGLQDLRDFKKNLLFNATIHIVALIACIHGILSIVDNTASLFTTIAILLWIPINIYCIMLQRYNQIRINKVIKKMEPHEEIKKSELKKELIKEDSLLGEHTYKVVNKRYKEKNVTFEELLETATYNQLKQYRDYLSYFREVNQMMKECQNDYSNEQPSVSVPIQKNKTLRLELTKKQNENSN